MILLIASRQDYKKEDWKKKKKRIRTYEGKRKDTGKRYSTYNFHTDWRWRLSVSSCCPAAFCARSISVQRTCPLTTFSHTIPLHFISFGKKMGPRNGQVNFNNKKNLRWTSNRKVLITERNKNHSRLPGAPSSAPCTGCVP